MNNTTFYIGVTADLSQRIYQHRQGLIEGFSRRYRLKKLVYFEEHSTIIDAIAREKQLKNWHRSWKMNLIRQSNPDFKDLYPHQDAERDPEIDPEPSSG